MPLSEKDVNDRVPVLMPWVHEVAKLTKPVDVILCDGSEEEAENIIKEMLRRKELIKLNESEYKNCYLFRNEPDDVARVEDRTFICTVNKDDAGPTNNWMPIGDAKKLMNGLFDGIMAGRTMYVVPYLMGPAGSEYSRFGIEVTDSPLVVLTIRILTRMGRIALEQWKNSETFTKGIHSMGDLNKENRYIMHFPDESLIMSINTNYGGNAALSKKPHAIRIASVDARKHGWLAEHMFIAEIEDPAGKKFYMSGALSSGSGKTNMAMMQPPERFKDWKIRAVGDDIAWLYNHKGKIMAINPENGFFGIAYDTGPDSNPNILDSIKKNTIFTNVGLTPDNKPWWEGLTKVAPEGVFDWTGKRWVAGSNEVVANKNSRYSTPLKQYKFRSDDYDNPDGVPISAMVFGGRRDSLVPLVYETSSWEQGVLLGAMMQVETTAPISGRIGVIRHDPMAMVAFCGYNMGDYFKHWLDFGRTIKTKPKIFFVNWFRKDASGKFLWPGFSENFRVLKWMMERSEGKIDAVSTPLGYVPKIEDMDLVGLSVEKEKVEKLLEIDKDGWLKELEAGKEFFEKFGSRMPKEVWDEYYTLEKRLKE